MCSARLRLKLDRVVIKINDLQWIECVSLATILSVRRQTMIYQFSHLIFTDKIAQRELFVLEARRTRSERVTDSRERFVNKISFL